MFRHVHETPTAPMCLKWCRNFNCGNLNCTERHPQDLYTGLAVPKAVADSFDHAGQTAAVFWDMNTCPVPAECWWYSVATCVDRFLRVLGLLQTGPGWRLFFVAATPMMTSISRRRELIQGRVQPHIVGETSGAVVAKLKAEFIKFGQTTYPERTSAIVVISGDPEMGGVMDKAARSLYKVVHVHPGETAKHPTADNSIKVSPTLAVQVHASSRIRCVPKAPDADCDSCHRSGKTS
jgi:hypothetical protein